MNKKSDVRNGVLVVTAVMALFFECSNPVNEAPVQWGSKVVVPVTNESFVIGEQLGKMFPFDSMDILNVLQRYYDDPAKLQPDTIIGDTVAFSVLKVDSSEFESHQEAFSDKTFHVNLGPIPLVGAPVQSDTLPLPSGAGAFAASQAVSLEDVYRIVFYDTSSNILKVSLTNNALSALTEVSFGIVGVDTVSVGMIESGATGEAELLVSGKTVTDSAVVVITGSALAGAGKSLGVTFSLNGLLGEQVKVDDHLVQFSEKFSNPYELTDTINIDYIDIEYGFFHYSITNYTGLDLRVQGVHNHLWATPFCVENGFGQLEAMGGLIAEDSLRFLGNITPAQTFSPSGAMQTFSTANLSGSRLFPEWSDSLKKSITNVTYYIASGTPKGDTVTLSARDSLLFTIQTTAFIFKELLGTSTEAYERQSDTQMVPINLPWNNSVKDSLRGRFVLKSVWGDMKVNTLMPEGAFIDTLLIDFIAYAPESLLVQDTALASFIHINRDSTYYKSIDITDVVNVQSDSIAIAVRVHVPTGTRMRVVNDLKAGDPDFSRYIGRMLINVLTSYRLNAKLDWEVVDTVNMDLGSSRFKILEALRFFRKLEQKRGTFEMWLKNNSNMSLSLFALAAPDALLDTLDSLSINEVNNLISTIGRAEERGLVNVFGTDGIIVPPRNSETVQYNAVVLDDRQLETILAADSIGFRWCLRFNPQTRDALHDTDWVDLRSRLGVEGINNTDSLLIW